MLTAAHAPMSSSITIKALCVEDGCFLEHGRAAEAVVTVSQWAFIPECKRDTLWSAFHSCDAAADPA